MFNISYKYKITLGDYFSKVYFNKNIVNKNLNNFLNKKISKIYPKIVKIDLNKRIESFIND